MSLVPITNVGEVGIIQDIPPYNLPPNAWSGGNNVRFLDNGVKKVAGYEAVMATVPFPPYYIQPFLDNANTYYWIAYGATNIAVWDGATWTDVTRQTTMTLNGGVAASAASITVSAGTALTNLDATGTLLIGNQDASSATTNAYEKLTYSARNTSTGVITLTGTTASAHPNGAVVTPEGSTATLDSDYSANLKTNRWQATNLNGLIVATNGTDGVQTWPLNASAIPELTTPFREIRNWPFGDKCKIVRSFRTFLVGLNWTRSAIEETRMVKWSTAASFGLPPVTWDESDATLDAGEYQLADTPGDIIDGMAFGDSFLIYKNDAIYIMNYVGTPYIFSFKLLSPTIGCLTKNALAEFDAGHFFMGNSDFYVCNGQSVKALLPEKLRRTVFENLNGANDNYKKCFVAADYVRNEMLACYPSGSSNEVNKAVIWNWKTGTFSLRDLPDTSHINSGIVAITVSNRWGAQATLNEASMTPSSPASSGNLTVVTTTATPSFTSSGTLILQGNADPYVGEQITYTGLTGTTFTGITRGANGTVAAAHTNGIPVNQTGATWNTAAGAWGTGNYDNVAENLIFARPGVVTSSSGAAAAITGATAADPVVITAAGHGLSNDDTVMIDDVVGMVQLNGNTYTVAGATTDTFQLSGVDGSAYTAYSSGGELLQPKIYRDNAGNKNDTANMTSYIERTGYDLDDPAVVKFVSAVYPHLEVSGDNSVNVYVGSQMSTEGAVDWGSAISFNPNSQSKVSCRVTGKLFGVKIESSGDFDWKLHSLAFEVQPRGNRGIREY